MNKLLPLLLFAAVLAACAGAPTPSASTPVSSVGLDVPPATATSAPPAAIVQPTDAPSPTSTPTLTPTATPVPLIPLQIDYLRQRQFPGSDIKIEQTLAPGSNYNQFIASYQSDGLKIYGLLTVPRGNKPATGWPVIIFNHGYIPPSQYRTTERYVAYVDALARNGYIVFKSDYRGHGSSEGRAGGGYGSPDYTIDVLNALSSMERYPDADPNRIGMWGHSMGGQVTLRSMVVSKDIKAGVIWAGVVGSYPNIVNNWHRNPNAGSPTPGSPNATPYTDPYSGYSRGWRNSLVARYGSPEQNPTFWASISPNSYVADISGPVQLHSSVNDSEVPIRFSQELFGELQQAGKTTEMYKYPGDDHNIANSFGLAMQRTIQFFDKYVKGAGS